MCIEVTVNTEGCLSELQEGENEPMCENKTGCVLFCFLFRCSYGRRRAAAFEVGGNYVCTKTRE